MPCEEALLMAEAAYGLSITESLKRRLPAARPLGRRAHNFIGVIGRARPRHIFAAMIAVGRDYHA